MSASLIRSVVAKHALAIPPHIAHVVSITDVEVSADFSYADIYVSALQNVEAAIKFLNNNKGPIRKELSGGLRSFRLPLLRYHVDTRGERGSRIDRLLAGENPDAEVRNRGNR